MRMSRHPSVTGRGRCAWAPHAARCAVGAPAGSDAWDGRLQWASVALAGSLRHLRSVQVSWCSSVAFVGSVDQVFKLLKVAAPTVVVCGGAVSLEDVFSLLCFCSCP